jgi:hypothetical protein
MHGREKVGDDGDMNRREIVERAGALSAVHADERQHKG